VVASPRAVAARAALDPLQLKKLLWWVDRLKANVFSGDQIPKDRIPGSLSDRSDLTVTVENAWRFELPGAFRGIYTVVHREGRKPTIIVLEILSHKDYDRLFGHR
jgi:hypothetical protein